jgi:cellobiose-specific phosphotransferase system component IIC
MFNFDKQTFLVVAVIVCLGINYYLYKENQKQQSNMKNIVSVISQINRPPANEARKKKVVTIVDPIQTTEVLDEKGGEEDSEE